MIFKETKLAGAFVIEQNFFEDVRGFFAQCWSAREFAEQGLNPRLVECNFSYNRRKGTLRGMHFQSAPHAQAKLVRCTAGAIYDAIIDLRPESETFKQWVGVELTAKNYRMLYVPEGFAHGFQTLDDDTEVLYQVSDVFAPELAGGVRWDDPAFGIEWPDNGGDERIIIARDREYTDFNS
ncbi:MAG TPA: dTDP-4-dehydrorhamnose 3,5-epimerase [Pyrinomonadaceae bacterium]|nr:dTDP-4-dehydrorhamnose 3,5-epimerase [Pyrinomonadaceae bacterium]